MNECAGLYRGIGVADDGGYDWRVVSQRWHEAGTAKKDAKPIIAANNNRPIRYESTAADDQRDRYGI
jgi:hypothetical protein